MTKISGIMGFQAGGGLSSSEEFLTSGIWSVPSGVTICTVFLVGGGGGGGGGAGVAHGGGGGGGAEIVQAQVYLGSETSVSITIGAGGLGGVYQAAGAVGEATSFGSFVSANFGYGGAVTSGSYGYYGGYGGGRYVGFYTTTTTAYTESLMTRGDGGGRNTSNEVGRPGTFVTLPNMIIYGGAGGGQGGYSGANASVGGASAYATGGSRNGNLSGGGGGASWGDGSAGSNNGSNAADNTGAGAGGGYSSGNTGGDGGSGYALVMWNE